MEPRRRLTRKQPVPPHWHAPPAPAPLGDVQLPIAHVLQPAASENADGPALAALADEAWSELRSLDDTVRRKHIHWTHVHTNDLAHQQPESFSREGFWEHLCKVYAEVYPEVANESGSILLFGLVVKERHAESGEASLRAEHHHAAVYCSRQHYWRPVAKRSLEVYHVQLHAACHSGYASMYQYLRAPSLRKPLAEIDTAAYFSLRHPQGETLRRLLEVGAAAERGHAGRRRPRSSDTADAASSSRLRKRDMYEFVTRTGIRTPIELQAFAQNAAANGDPRYAEFCTIYTEKDLQQLLDSAWSVIDAPSRLADRARQLQTQHATCPAHPIHARSSFGGIEAFPAHHCVRGKRETRALRKVLTRPDRLHRAAAAPCRCSGAWVPGALLILANNDEDAPQFAHDIHQALVVGARRGVNVAVVGGPGLGKSTLFEPLLHIFRVGSKPERNCSFPLSSIVDAEVLLWQDFVYSRQVCAFEDLLNILVGEQIAIRLPGHRPVNHRNTAPMFYTARAPLEYHSRDACEAAEQTAAMAERFITRRWTRPLPLHLRRPDFAACGACFARFVLESEAQWQLRQGAGDLVYL